ncbi:MAG: RDD family protein [Rhizobiaceae bacterium]|nr:RDD family protein [Rhizobiaceae bacterium]
MAQAQPILTLDPETGDEVRIYDGVLRRRIGGFVIDVVIISLIVAVAAAVVGIIGVLTLGLGWLLYAILVPMIVLPYVAFTLGGPEQATPGMRMAGVKLVSDTGKPVDWALALVHYVLFWAFNTVLSPFILLVALFTQRKRTLHDVLLGTSVVRM